MFVSRTLNQTFHNDFKLVNKALSHLLSLGSEIALLLSLPIILGSYIDEYFEFKALGLISGALLGIILFFFEYFAY